MTIDNFSVSAWIPRDFGVWGGTCYFTSRLIFAARWQPVCEIIEVKISRNTLPTPAQHPVPGQIVQICTAKLRAMSRYLSCVTSGVVTPHQFWSYSVATTVHAIGCRQHTRATAHIATSSIFNLARTRLDSKEHHGRACQPAQPPRPHPVNAFFVNALDNDIIFHLS
jgi:hypothetical protein